MADLLLAHALWNKFLRPKIERFQKEENDEHVDEEEDVIDEEEDVIDKVKKTSQQVADFLNRQIKKIQIGEKFGNLKEPFSSTTVQIFLMLVMLVLTAVAIVGYWYMIRCGNTTSASTLIIIGLLLLAWFPGISTVIGIVYLIYWNASGKTCVSVDSTEKGQ